MMDRSRDLTTSGGITPYASDRPVGLVLMLFAAIGIPFHMFAGIASGFVRLLHAFHESVTFTMGNATGGSMLHTMFQVALLAGLVFAGYGISRSQKQAFLIAIPLAALSIVFHAAFVLGLAFLVYSALRMMGSLRATAPQF